jgi:hypothetical protein
MSANPNEQDELEAPEAEEDLEDVDEDELLEEDDAGDDDEAVAGADEEDDSTSLDELLAQRAAARRAGDDADDDDALLALASEAELPVTEAITTRVIPMKDRQEFVCNRCHLVKAKSQLADPQRGLCRDCV